jgi:alkylation response protein AidB-like acyl-CoA dehydrogenase
MTMTDGVPATHRPDDIEAFRSRARAWLSEHVPSVERSAADLDTEDFDVSIFHDLSREEEEALIARRMEWQRTKFAGGYGAIAWPHEFGGAALSSLHEQAFEEEEAAFDVPDRHEVCSVTLRLVAPTIRAVGTIEQQQQLIPPFLAGDQICSQLFSEPGAGSDLAGVSTRAVRDGDEWILNGQKVWSSGAQYAHWGEVLCRTDPSVPKHAGQTMFLVPLDTPGVEVRPIRQMSGGASFNEVFLTDVRVPDSLRLGEVGKGWKVALTTLGFERASSGSHSSLGGSWDMVLALARRVGVTDDPVMRQKLARLYTADRLRRYQALRLEGLPAGVDPGPAGSIGKLAWTQWMTEVSGVIGDLLGARLAADTGEWGTYAWNKHLLGAPGYRIAGGSDEVQRNIIGERVLGLPREPRIDRDVPFSEVPR